MKPITRIQLSAMMFLEFFVWGGWFVTMGTYLGKTFPSPRIDVQIGIAYTTQSLGAIIAPFVIGFIADRFFTAQKILGVLHLSGAVLLWFVADAPFFGTFYTLILIYMIIYMPTLALVNSISFRQMKQPAFEFPPIRVLGTIGWITAGLLIGLLALERKGELGTTFRIVSVASALLGLFSFTLPDTPPPKGGDKKSSISDILGLDALALFKNRSYLIFFLASVALCIPLAFYYNFTNPFLNETGVKAAAAKQSIGQMSEVLFMLIMPFLFLRLGVKRMLLLGMLAWVLRYVLFAFGDTGSAYWMLIGGIILHGVCYDFFFVTGQIYTDRLAGERYKSAAQGMITLATYGVGMLCGSVISGYIVNKNILPGGTHQWREIWLVPAAIAAAVLLMFSLFFKDKKMASGQGKKIFM